MAVKLLDESNGQTCTITVGNSPKPEELRGNNDSEDDSGIETEDEREVEEEETDEVDDREGDVKEEGSITTVYVKDLRDDCTRTAFPNGISKVEINDFKDDWCLEQVEIELADGEKYGCSGEGDIESCTPEKLQDAGNIHSEDTHNIYKNAPTNYFQTLLQFLKRLPNPML